MKKILTPKQSIAKDLKKRGLSKNAIVTFDFFQRKYFNSNPLKKLNESKKTEVTEIKAFKDIIRGNFYTFEYDPLYKDILDFYDTRPIILAFNTVDNKNTKNKLIYGINLTFIPFEMKRIMLDIYWDKLFNVGIEKLYQHKEKFFKKEILNPNFNYYKLLEDLFDNISKVGFKFAIRCYILDRVDFLKPIEVDDRYKTAFISSEELYKKSLKEIYSLYWQYRRMKIK